MVSPIQRPEGTKFIVALLFCCVAATIFFSLLCSWDKEIHHWWASDGILGTALFTQTAWRLPKWCLSRSSALKLHVCPKQKAIYNRTNSRPSQTHRWCQFPTGAGFFKYNWTYLEHIKDISVHIFAHRSKRLSEKNVFLISALLTRGN